MGLEEQKLDKKMICGRVVGLSVGRGGKNMQRWVVESKCQQTLSCRH